MRGGLGSEPTRRARPAVRSGRARPSAAEGRASDAAVGLGVVLVVGLGLSLVKAYAEQLAMTVQVALEPGPVFRITLRQSSADLQPALRGT